MLNYSVLIKGLQLKLVLRISKLTEKKTLLSCITD